MSGPFRISLPLGTPVVDVLDIFARRGVEGRLGRDGTGWIVEFSCAADQADHLTRDVTRVVESAHGVGTGGFAAATLQALE
jgi:hypothetical protein